ncbi:flagellar operon protein [Paenibacillus rhizosphaerae]|uniref:Flagellar operon protein n=1 Tax=Paenibacillus rhizosphaerae TaxID=297318 RepID=A0A839TGC3_9BACL|nr:TIGR02530 family flagellar biosynthesis protein [Paenibacillus rhizosphaerae]MBB3125886.1 flagellar operon protein [Paenibacillus rhizosphaerae]
MNERMTIGQLYPGRIYPAAPVKTSKPAGTPDASSHTSFDELLQGSLLKFSNHAAKRLEQRGIEIKGEQLERLNQAVEKAAAKGSKESLILMKDMALIVNVPNRTVVTAMDGKSMKDNVFTQIDSAVVLS